MTLKRFLIERTVTSAAGTQIFFVDANSEEEALAKHKNGDGGMYSSEVEVQSLGEPCISGTTNLDDGGDFANNPNKEEV